MRRASYLAASLMVLSWPVVSLAADLAFVGPRGTPAEQAASSLLSQSHSFDRSVALEDAATVVDAVKTGGAAGGMIPAIAAKGVPGETTSLLLSALDPGLRIVDEVRVPDRQDSATGYWVIARTKERLPEQHPDRLVVNVDAPAGSKAFSLVVAGLSKLGFTVTGVTFIPLPGKPLGFRYLLVLAADKPILGLRLTDAVSRDSRTGDGRAVVIGGWRQVP